MPKDFRGSKKMIKGKKDRFWEMRLAAGPYGDEDGGSSEVFKCTGCGAETAPDNGWNGEPSTHNCHPGCPCQLSDWKIGSSRAYRNNFDRIFPNAPGAGL
jgi:hypothetical protein